MPDDEDIIICICARCHRAIGPEARWYAAGGRCYHHDCLFPDADPSPPDPKAPNLYERAIAVGLRQPGPQPETARTLVRGWVGALGCDGFLRVGEALTARGLNKDNRAAHAALREGTAAWAEAHPRGGEFMTYVWARVLAPWAFDPRALAQQIQADRLDAGSDELKTVASLRLLREAFVQQLTELRRARDEVVETLDKVIGVAWAGQSRRWRDGEEFIVRGGLDGGPEDLRGWSMFAVSDDA
jgi:hypothetical protein